MLVAVVLGWVLRIPTTVLTPLDDNKLIVLFKTFNVVAAPLLPMLIPVIFPEVKIPEMVLLETVDVAPKALAYKAITAADPTDQLLNVFPVIVLVGDWVVFPSKLNHPVIVVRLGAVIFEKLLLVLLIVVPVSEVLESE